MGYVTHPLVAAVLGAVLAGASLTWAESNAPSSLPIPSHPPTRTAPLRKPFSLDREPKPSGASKPVRPSGRPPVGGKVIQTEEAKKGSTPLPAQVPNASFGT
ncbi:MAG: hypothetical protein ACO1SV_20505 [Fimbriimonas sp.]